MLSVLEVTQRVPPTCTTNTDFTYVVVRDRARAFRRTSDGRHAPRRSHHWTWGGGGALAPAALAEHWGKKAWVVLVIVRQP